MDQQQAGPGSEHAPAFIRDEVEFRRVDVSEEDVVWAVFAGADGDILVDKHDGRGLVRPRQTAISEYLMTSLRRRDGRYAQRRVHQLVARAFLGPPPSPAHVVDHADGVPVNNAAVNLRWVTHAANRQNRTSHMQKHARSPKGRIRMIPVSMATASAVQRRTRLKGNQLYRWVERVLLERIGKGQGGVEPENHRGEKTS